MSWSSRRGPSAETADQVPALGRTHEAAGIWRRFLTLATSPELVQRVLQEAGIVGNDTDGAEIIDRVKAKLAALTVRDL